MNSQHFQLNIPEPCSEKWAAMSVVDEQQRHCQACDRVLTDFSGMTETELVLWLKHSSGKVCGRFAPQQLNRTLTLPTSQPKQKHWLNALWLLPLSWFATEARAQNSNETLKSKPTVSVQNGDKTETTTNLNGQSGIMHPAVIKGVVYDKDTHEALPFVTVYIQLANGSRPLGTNTDIDGNYSIKLPDSLRTQTFTLVYNYVGYTRHEIRMDSYSGTESLKAQPLNVMLVSEEKYMTVGIIIMSPAETGQSRDRHSIWSKARLVFGFGKK